MTAPSLEPIRQAVTSGEFYRAQLLWQQCADALTEDLNNRRLSEARLSEVRELLAWSRGVILCARAHLLMQLNSLHVAGEYETGVSPPARRLVSASF